MNLNISSYLSEIDCCKLCISLFLGNADGNLDILENEYNSQSEGSTEDILQTSTKKSKSLLCLACLGIFQYDSVANALDKLSNAIQEEHYDSPDFSLGISLPISMGLRLHRIWACLLQKFPEFKVESARTNHLGSLKDTWRRILGQGIERRTSKSMINSQTTLQITIHVNYPQDLENCRVLELLDKGRFESRRKQNRKFAEGLYTKQVVEDTLKGLSDERLLQLVPGLPTSPDSVPLFEVSLSQTSVFLAGRYNKFSRCLPQTPWLVSEDRQLDSSVQELISEPLVQFIRCDGVKFSSSGREDVDVRCLGDGRPFAIECLNPRKTNLSQRDLAICQAEINGKSLGRISVKDLQVVSKKDTVHLNDDETEKMKFYCALCVIRDPPRAIGDLSDALSPLANYGHCTIKQTTPVRVLHRRTLSVRERGVQVLRFEPVGQQFFKLYLKTQAGTYIKEFVHGDFGRTVPNVKQILGLDCDILALDVENVELDWPPSITPEMAPN